MASLIAAAALLIGCGDDGDESEDAATTLTTIEEETTTTTARAGSACALITPADIESVLEISVEPGELSEVDNTTTCSFASAGTTSVSVLRADGPRDIRLAYLDDPDAREVPGLADGAFLVGLSVIDTQAGDVSLSISVNLQSAPDEGDLIDLAKIGLSRL